MIEYDDAALFNQDGIGKQLSITYGESGEITNSDLASEDFCLTEKLTSNGTFVLGECNSAYIEFSVGYGTEPLEGQELTVTTTPTGAEEPFQIGKYTVVSDKPTADRRWRKITAYDALYAVINMDVTEWYNTVLPVPEEGEEPTAISIKDLRDSFFEEVGIEQEEVELPCDEIEVTRQADFTQITGKTVLNAICEINGCFGRIDRSGVFRYTYLQSPSEPFYPAMDLFPADNLYPKYAGSVPPTEIGQNGKYMSAKYEDYFVEQFTAVTIRNDKNDVGTTVGSGQTYTVEGNFLAYGLAAATLTTIANNILESIAQVYFCPAEIVAQGNPCLEIGDAIVLHTRYATIETYLLQRKLKGIQSLIDTYTSKGTKDQKKNLNSTASKLVQTEGKINEVKADLVTAKKVIAEQIEADEARIGYIESNYVQTSTLVANYATITSLETVDGKIDNLTSIAITSQNIDTVTLNASQITTGTIDTARLDVATIAAQTVTASNISGACVSPDTGSITMGTIRGKYLYWYTDLTGGNNPSYHLVGSTLINGTRVLTVS